MTLDRLRELLAACCGCGHAEIVFHDYIGGDHKIGRVLLVEDMANADGTFIELREAEPDPEEGDG